MHHVHSKRGFTLIELLVVIAIIGILATIVIIQLGGAQTRARNSQAKSDVTEGGKAVETWKTTNGIDNVPNATAISSGAPGTKVNGGTATQGWTTLFGQASGSTAFPVTITKTPSASYTYGYATVSTTNAATEAAVTAASASASSATYCVGTNVVSSGSVSDSGFYVNTGSNGNSTTAAVTYLAAGACS